MTERIIDGIRQILDNDMLTTFLIAIIPIVELRGAIPAAMTMGISPWAAFALAWLGSAIVSPILLLILRPILNLMKKSKLFSSLADAVESGFKSKAQKVVGEDGEASGEAAKKLERKKMLGVYLFVAFPIPLTGVWTGSAVATFLDLPFFKSLAMVWLGNLTAGVIVTVLAIFLQEVMSTVLDVFFIIVLLVLLLYIVRIVVKIVKNKKAGKLLQEKSSEGSLDTLAERNQASEENASSVASGALETEKERDVTAETTGNSDGQNSGGESMQEQVVLTAKVIQKDRKATDEKEE